MESEDTLELRKLEAEIKALEAEARKNNELAENAILESKFRERRLAEELSSLADAHVYHFFGEVKSSSCTMAIEEIGTWSRRDPGCDITIIFNSPGGSVWDGLALYDFLRDLSKRGHNIVTKSIGRAASIGGVLLQAGDERIMSPHGFILMHEMSGAIVGKGGEWEDATKLYDKLQDKIVNILTTRSKMTKVQLKRAFKRKDYWIDAEEALKLGFIDRIEE